VAREPLVEKVLAFSAGMEISKWRHLILDNIGHEDHLVDHPVLEVKIALTRLVRIQPILFGLFQVHFFSHRIYKLGVRDVWGFRVQGGIGVCVWLISPSEGGNAPLETEINARKFIFEADLSYDREHRCLL